MRRLFGGGPADYVISAGDPDGSGGKQAVLEGGVEVTFWDALTGGNQYDDLQTYPGGTPITSVTTADTGDLFGYWPLFYGEDGGAVDIDVMYADANGGAGPRFPVHAVDSRVYKQGAQTITGPLTIIGQLTVVSPDKDTIALVVKRDADVVSTADAEMVQNLYKTYKGWALNEKNQSRARRVDSEVVKKTFARGNDSSANTAVDIEQWYRDNGGIDSMCARMGAAGGLYHALNDLTNWANITVDSPTTPGLFTAYAQDANGGTPQVRVIEGGTRAELSGAINVTGAAGADAVIASALPTALTYRGMGGTVSAVPARRRGLAAGSAGSGAQRLRVTSAGVLQIVGTIASATTIYLDGLSYRLD